MTESATKYIIRADDMSLANGLYYMSRPFYEEEGNYDEGDFIPEDAIPYHWATHPTNAHQYDSEDEAREVIRGLPTHCKPEVIPFEQALDEHIGLPAGFPFNVKYMPSDEQARLMQHSEPPAEKYIPYTGPPLPA